MFNDFDGHEEEDEGKGRRVASLGLSALLYGALGLLAATAVTAAGAAVVERQVLVEFAPPPPMPVVEEPEPEAPKPEEPRVRRSSNNRPRAARSPETPPSSIPEGQLAESEAALAEAGETGVVEGYVDGEGAGEPPGPVVEAEEVAPRPSPGQVREMVSRPRYLSGCPAPTPPDAIRTTAETIRITVRMVIDPTGHPARVTVTEGNPLIPEDLVVGCAMQQVFAAATLPDGTAVPYPYLRRFVFRPSNL